MDSINPQLLDLEQNPCSPEPFDCAFLTFPEALRQIQSNDQSDNPPNLSTEFAARLDQVVDSGCLSSRSLGQNQWEPDGLSLGAAEPSGQLQSQSVPRNKSPNEPPWSHLQVLNSDENAEFERLPRGFHPQNQTNLDDESSDTSLYDEDYAAFLEEESGRQNHLRRNASSYASHSLSVSIDKLLE